MGLAWVFARERKLDLVAATWVLQGNALVATGCQRTVWAAEIDDGTAIGWTESGV